MQQHLLKIIVRQFGLCHYEPIAFAMRQFTNSRHPDTLDEIWLVEHYPIFTQGKTGKVEHLLMPSDIPVLQSDRGGQITYHGPGQQLMYILIDLKRRKLGVRQLVTAIEQAVVNTLIHYNVNACIRPYAPGVYVTQKKICSLGLRICHGNSFHGLALNIDMDLSPFKLINPCGYAKLEMTQLSIFCHGITLADVQPVLIKKFLQQLSIL